MAKQNVCFENNCFTVDLAETYGQQTKGLMNRDSLREREGMLFVYDREEPHAIWMKDMKFAIDIVWLNENKEVIFIEENVPPCVSFNCSVYKADSASAYVLELPAGTAATIGLTKKSVMK
ncbi:MAG: DUF192 domain-containing protein [Patescibacteria group bacterium]